MNSFDSDQVRIDIFDALDSGRTYVAGAFEDKTSACNPILYDTQDPCVKTISFACKVPDGDDNKPLADAGALNFTLELGTVYDDMKGDKKENERKAVKWNGIYNGKGGEFPKGNI